MYIQNTFASARIKLPQKCIEKIGAKISSPVFMQEKKKSLKWCALLLWIILFKCIRLYFIYFCVFFTQYSQICKFIQEKLDAACKWNAYKILSLVSKHQNYSYIDFEFEGWAHFLTCTDLVWSDHPSLLSTMSTP